MGWAELQSWRTMAGQLNLAHLCTTVPSFSHVPRLCALCENGGVRMISANNRRVVVFRYLSFTPGKPSPARFGMLGVVNGSAGVLVMAPWLWCRVLTT